METDRPTTAPAQGRRLVRLGLRSRIVVAFLVFGLVLSSGFAAADYFAMDDFEAIVVRHLLRGEMQQTVDLRRLDPDTPLPSSRRMHARVAPLSGLETLPPRLRALRPGIHVLDEDGEHETYVQVRDVGGQRFFYFIALGDVAERERFVQWLLAAIVILGTLVSGGVGLLFAGRLISPVQRLARWVDTSTPEHPAGPLAAQFADDEVGALAASFDRYQSRLEAFLRREREFTADAGHELRSPLSVLKAGLDLLLEEPGVRPSGRRALHRMDRRAAELSDLLDALLYLARAEPERDSSVAEIRLLPAWRRVFEDQLPAVAPETAAARVTGDPHATASAPPRIAHLVFSRLLGYVIDHAGEAPVRVEVEQGWIRIWPWSAGSAGGQGDKQSRSDEGLGVTLLSRLCLRIGWQLESAPAADHLVLRFSEAATATLSG